VEPLPVGAGAGGGRDRRSGKPYGVAETRSVACHYRCSSASALPPAAWRSPSSRTSAADGKVRQIHIASLGAVPWPPSVVDRDAFWARLHERLARLANRVDRETQNAILEQILARTPTAWRCSPKS
jgi:hypothetical protein